MSVVLIISVFVIYRQLNYMKSYDLRFDKEQVVLSGNWRFGKEPGTRHLLREKLLIHPDITVVAFTNGWMGAAGIHS